MDARILIVEDEQVVGLNLRRLLRSWGYTKLTLVASGHAAIGEAAAFLPDLVLMDVALEERMDGVEAAARIQQLGPVPVIFVTAHGDDLTTSRALQSSGESVVRFINKPIDEQALRTSIEVVLKRPTRDLAS